MSIAQPPPPATRGIAGAVWTDAARALPGESLDRMLAALGHRGGNAHRHFRRELTRGAAHVPVPGVMLGETCAVDDPYAPAADAAWAPAMSEDRSVVAVLDGFLLNHATLRHRLEGAGHHLRGDSHAELLVHLYEDQGPDCFAHVEGPLAAAVWDTNRRTLVLARDRCGQKPLFYRVDQGRLLFANALQALADVADAPCQVDPTALDECLTFGYVPHPHCLYRGYRKLPPGYCAICRDGELTFRRYWQPDFQREDDRPAAELRRDLWHRLEAAVAACMADHDRVGVWLSGGLDSAIVAALAQRASPRPIYTFCVQALAPEQDESAAAEAIAAALGTRHETVPMGADARDLASLPDQVRDGPALPKESLAQQAAARRAAESVAVVLTGIGADELFAGYPRHGSVLTWQERLLPRWLRACFDRKAPKGDSPPAILDEARGRSYLSQIALLSEAARGELYSEEFLATLPNADPYDWLRAALAQSRGRNPVTAVSLADLVTSLPCQTLAGLDAVVAPLGLECRHPYLDVGVVELAVGIPGHLKWRRGLGKRILRKTFADLLPAAVLCRPHRPWPEPATWRGVLDQLRSAPGFSLK